MLTLPVTFVVVEPLLFEPLALILFTVTQAYSSYVFELLPSFTVIVLPVFSTTRILP